MVHAGAFAAAFLIPWLTLPQTLLFLLAAFIGNFSLRSTLPWVLPKHRVGDGHLETLHYPLSLIVTFIAFACLPGSAQPLPWSLEGWHQFEARWKQPGSIFSADMAWPVLAWMTLALGDPVLGLFQRTLAQGPSLPWNPRKRWLPWLIAMACLIPLLTLISSFLLPIPWTLAATAISIALCAETLWIGIDDNWLIPFVVCMVGLFPLIWPDGSSSSSLFLPQFWGWLAPVLFGVGAWAFRKLTPGGALLGTAFGFLFWQAHPILFLGLCLFFALGVGATQFGMQVKTRFGLAEARRGQRGAPEVFGAMGIAAWTSALPIAYRHLGAEASAITSALLVPLAVMTAKTMDTVSSEIGKAVRGKTYVPPYFRPAEPGEEGGMSWQGTLAGIVGAGFFLLPLALTPYVSVPHAILLLLIAFAANLGESLWARYWHRKNVDPGVQTNVALCAFAALLAWWIFIGFLM
jgi:uncharacterized protein (TIGR00297 family)